MIPQRGSYRSGSCGWVVLVFQAVFILWVSPSSGAGGTVGESEPLRFAFSSRMFAEVNRNDAKASVKAWALALARERGVPMDTQPLVLDGVEQLRDALRRSTIEGAAVTTEEYFSLEPELQGTNLFVSFNARVPTEEYLLMVRRDSGISGLEDLKGRSLVVFENPRSSLAPLWLDLELAELGLGGPATHFGQITRVVKLMKVVPPVFFRQSDACLVTRRGFDIMCEMNPQVKGQLQILASSPKLVPALGFIRNGYASPLRDLLLGALRDLEHSPSGSQVLTLFQSEQLLESTPECLESARVLVEAHRQLAARSPMTENRPVVPAAAPEKGRSP